jgi:hypothetical protein
MQPYYFDQVTNGGALSNPGTTPANIPNLTYNVLAGCTYEFAVYVFWQGSATTTTAKFCMGGTCTSSLLNYTVALGVSTNGSASTFSCSVLNPGVGARASAVVVDINTNLTVSMRGRIVVSASGTLTAQAGTGVVTVNVQSGGIMTLTQVA